MNRDTALLIIDVQVGIGYDNTSRVTMGYDVTLVSDAHTTIDNNILSAAQIIEHRNALLNGCNAGPHAITVKPADEVAY